MADINVPQVYNHDIVGIYNRLNRFLMELALSVSSNVSQMNLFDQARLQSYLDNITRYTNHVVAQPQLDLPETTPMLWDLEPMMTLPDTENEEIADLLRILRLSELELINSQSARLGSGLIPFDERRFRAVIAKAQAFLTDYIQVATPLDLPESSPDEVVTGIGKTGV